MGLFNNLGAKFVAAITKVQSLTQLVHYSWASQYVLLGCLHCRDKICGKKTLPTVTQLHRITFYQQILFINKYILCVLLKAFQIEIGNNAST